jgi:alpha-N-arabinofuranosidase
MRVIVSPKVTGAKISKDVYGHFSEHLGRCIYGGIFVGEGSPIKNVRGIRSDVVAAMKHIKVPNMRWPGGCFADEYHWKDGIGPKANRKKMINNHWGGVVEDNSFGTHEFMDFCEQVGCEPYINGNLGSGAVQEMQEWVEYMTSGEVSPMTQLRRQNGREEPWKLKFFGVGNENWGCGGSMRPEYYADEYRRYQTYVRNYSGNKLYKIACGAGTSPQNPGYDWTQVLMERAGGHMDGLSLHYYTVSGGVWEKKGSATEFDTPEYYGTLYQAAFLDSLLTGHGAIMDRYDPKGRVGLIMDEWGVWHNVEPGTNPGFLYQQNTMRDAMVAALSLNIMNKHARRVRMANLAQAVNVLQSLILTDGADMILTPTYHVFDLFRGHQESTLVATLVENEQVDTPFGAFKRISESASVDEAGNVHVTIANLHATSQAPVEMRLDGKAYCVKEARILAGGIHDKNTFEDQTQVKISPLTGVSVSPDPMGTEVSFTLPACSVAALTFEQA